MIPKKLWMHNFFLTKEELSDRLLDFAARCGKVTDALPNTRLGRHIGAQFVRASTSPAANYEEACAAESVRDFVHKLAIVLKELRESRIWIRLIQKAVLLKAERMADEDFRELPKVSGGRIHPVVQHYWQVDCYCQAEPGHQLAPLELEICPLHFTFCNASFVNFIAFWNFTQKT